MPVEKKPEAAFEKLNEMPKELAWAALASCCGSTAWIEAMLKARPFKSQEDLLMQASNAWLRLDPKDWLEAFEHHPRIGDVDNLRARFGSSGNFSEGEQAGMQGAQESVILGLAQGNKDYEAKFGFIFLVCATGKTAAEMLAMLQARMSNSAETELRIAAGEQDKITKIRLDQI